MMSGVFLSSKLAQPLVGVMVNVGGASVNCKAIFLRNDPFLGWVLAPWLLILPHTHGSVEYG